MTRALILVGTPRYSRWTRSGGRSELSDNRGWTGCDISWGPEAPADLTHRYDKDFRDKGMDDMNDFTRRIEELALEGGAADGNSEDEGANMDSIYSSDLILLICYQLNELAVS